MQPNELQVEGSTPSRLATVCRKCSAPIPNWTTTNGKRRNTRNRKFCLSCSPFGAHNTRQDDPAKLPKASRSDARAAWRKTANLAYANGKQLKRELIDTAGGCCSRCGYSKCVAALEFHHVDP